jgi:hexosaminidase
MITTLKLLSLQCIVFLHFSPQTKATQEFENLYDAINVWPMPKNITLPSNPLGSHIINIQQLKIKGFLNTVDEASVRALALEACTLSTYFKEPLRSYNKSAYSAFDNARCAPTARCILDSDCSNNSKCYIPSQLRWSSTTPCSPTSNLDLSAKCGCCISPAIPIITTLTITLVPPSTIKNKLKDEEVDESYKLNIDSNYINITTPSASGASNALSTLSQLFRWDNDISTLVTDVVPLSISDEPLYSWRGLMIDTARHFIPVNDILHLIDAASFAKINKIHIHATDSTAWTLSSNTYPELSQEGSWSRSNSTIYTKNDLLNVIKRGKERYVEIIFEIDTPAHSLSVARSHVEMTSNCWEWMATSGAKVDVDSDDTMALDPTNQEARKMIMTVLSEVADLQSESNRHVHIGGDEVKYSCWDSNINIKNHVIKTYGNNSNAAYSLLQAEWTANVSAAAVVAKGKIPVLWQPTTQGFGDPAWDNALPNNTVYMVWLNSQSAKSYAMNGRKVVYTTPYYVAGMGSNGYINVYNAQLMPNNLSNTEKKNVLGGQVCAWGESMGANGLDFRALSIGAGASESFWGNHPKGQGVSTSGGLGLGSRFNKFLCYTRRFHVHTSPIMPSFCNVVSGKKEI